MNLSRFEKEILMAHALKIERSYLIAHPELFDETNPKYLSFVKRRKDHEPIAYITGYQPFSGLDILVDQNVLVPRPETEELVELATTEITRYPLPVTRYNILDIGTGSGCIAIALAKNLANAKVLGIDPSVKALKLARKNAKRQNVSDRCRFEKGNLFGNSYRKYDLIISNPPYIPSGDIPGLMIDVRDWEPRSALDGGKDGLKYIKKIISQSPKYLNNGGKLMLESGFKQSKSVKSEAEKYFSDVKILKDLSGIDRFLIAKGRK